MASLHHMILHGKQFTTVGELTPEEHKMEIAYTAHTKSTLHSHETILVNANPVMRDLAEALDSNRWEHLDYSNIPCPKPPFHSMWLEATVSNGRTGALVERRDVHPTGDPLDVIRRFSTKWEHIREFKEQMPVVSNACTQMHARRPSNIMLIHLWQESPGFGVPGFNGEVLYWLDVNGQFQDSIITVWPPQPKDDEYQFGLRMHLHSVSAWVMHTFARLNCHNVKLVPTKHGKLSRPRQRKHHPPFSIWHEIVVEDPQVRCRQDTGTPSGEKQEIRFHRVRGHYADYTKGTGLFGKYKVRIWVEEHGRGQRELGEVVNSYAVK